MKAGELPVQLTSLVGREPQIDSIWKALRASRLVTLTGTAGAGKTRLAVEVAMRVMADGEAAVWFVDLAPVREPKLVGKAILAALGERDQTGLPAAERIATRLDGQAPLLVLDNCEQVSESCAAIALDLLRLLPELRLLATSRVPLQVPGEKRMPVPPLSEAESLELLADRARLVAPEFDLGADSAGVAAELVRRLDGLPLALELAAARMAQMPLAEVVSRLDRRLSLLVDRSPGADPRHRSLAAALDGSLDLLEPAERQFFAQLSVFVGGFGVGAAEAVAGADLDLLSRLVDESLLLPGRSSDGLARFRLLESVREYGADQLRRSDGEDAARRRHFEHYSVLAADAAVGLRGPDQVAWLDRLEEEHDNFRAALEWGARSEPEAAIEMAARLAWFWNVRGHFAESVRRLNDLLAEAPDAELPVRAGGLAALGRLAVKLARLARSAGGAGGEPGALGAARRSGRPLLRSDVAVPPQHRQQRTAGRLRAPDPAGAGGSPPGW